ncbi:uncharacterized protein RCC_03372 [Ramularia collo-cygni]|uniref:Uncharacterized protein n=1 Tax=Ramularia collo-cygni TaxID=112498 RepID=A0A2D3US49_9PEZI|nr:uncharacterized protein RCC_03372 [Ramularia collo-cygni]CZT17538.1 uncharacterized protein RCC_03372 [Ramularia collo-cygni]
MKRPKKTITKPTKAKKSPKKPIARKSTAKQSIQKLPDTVPTKAVKKPLKGTSRSNVSNICEPVESSPEIYCEVDRREHGTYKRCGRGALFLAHKASPQPNAPESIAAAMDHASSKMTSSNKTTKGNSKAQETDLNYDAVIRNGARMVLWGLDDLFERINSEPMASETSLKGVGEHVGGAIHALHGFLESSREYSNPNPKINYRKKFEEGDGIGNWISFKPSWFERGRFNLGDIMTFQSALMGLKAEGEVVTLHR